MVVSSLMGLVAGLVTTVAGMGGGLLLLLVLAALTDPMHALTVTAPALLLGNLHRAWLYRSALSRRVAGALVLGALPGALVGGALALALPDTVLRWTMGLVALLAVARAAGLAQARPPAVATAPAGFVTGLITATSGGAGVLVGPLLLAQGLTGAAYVGTMASGAVAMHAGRLLAYGAGGAVGPGVLLQGLALAGLIVVGNLAGDRVRRRLGPRVQGLVQVAVLLTTAGLAVVGVA